MYCTIPYHTRLCTTALYHAIEYCTILYPAYYYGSCIAYYMLHIMLICYIVWYVLCYMPYIVHCRRFTVSCRSHITYYMAYMVLYYFACRWELAHLSTRTTSNHWRGPTLLHQPFKPLYTRSSTPPGWNTVSGALRGKLLAGSSRTCPWDSGVQRLDTWGDYTARRHRLWLLKAERHWH